MAKLWNLKWIWPSKTVGIIFILSENFKELMEFWWIFRKKMCGKVRNWLNKMHKKMKQNSNSLCATYGVKKGWDLAI